MMKRVKSEVEVVVEVSSEDVSVLRVDGGRLLFRATAATQEDAENALKRLAAAIAKE